MLKRPYPPAAAVMDKVDFAAGMIAEEFASFGNRSTSMDEDGFGDIVRSDYTRKLCVAEILCGMLIRGRLQAAAFNVFMQLCLQGVCSLSSLEHPVEWVRVVPQAGSCQEWILSMLHLFHGFRAEWGSLQEGWNIERTSRWHDYAEHSIWLSTMIGRSFTSLSCVFDVICATEQLGPINVQATKKFYEECQPRSEWTANINTNRPQKWQGNRTFAWWLPEEIDRTLLGQGWNVAAPVLHQNFFRRVDRMEMHYATYFNIDRATFDADVQQADRDVRDWDSHHHIHIHFIS